jgi:hypothetical protein
MNPVIYFKQATEVPHVCCSTVGNSVVTKVCIVLIILICLNSVIQNKNNNLHVEFVCTWSKTANDVPLTPRPFDIHIFKWMIL